MVLDELLQTVGHVLPELIGSTGLELLGHAVFGLGNVKLSLLLWQVDLADTQVGAAHVEGKVSADLMAGGEAHAPGRVHWNVTTLGSQTLCELGDESVGNLLELLSRHDELLLELLNLLEQVLWNIGDGTFAAGLPTRTEVDHIVLVIRGKSVGVGIMRLRR